MNNAEEMSLAKSDSKSTISEELARKKEYFEKELAHVNAAIQFMQEHPDIQQGFDIIGKVIRN